MFSSGDEIFTGFTHIRADLDPPFALHISTEEDHTIDLADGGLLLGYPGLEQLRDPGQTARDVLRFGGLDGYFSDAVTGLDIIAFVHHDDGIGGHEVPCSGFSTRYLEGFTLIVLDGDPGLEIRTLVFSDHLRRDTRDLVNLFLHGHALAYITEFDLAAHLRENGGTEGIPFGKKHPLLNFTSVTDLEPGTVYDGISFLFTAVLINDGNLTVTVHHNEIARPVLNHRKINKAKYAVDRGFQRSLLDMPAGCTTDVEGSHGQLRARLPDGLGGDDTDRLTHCHELPAGQVTTVAPGADTAPGPACKS